MATKHMNAEQKQWLYGEFGKLEIPFWKSEANFIMFRSPLENDAFIPKMQQLGVMVRPCDGFDVEGCTRVTIGKQEDNEVFIQALRKVVSR